MRRFIIASIALFTVSATGASACERVFMSDDKTVVVVESGDGFLVDGVQYGLMGCGSGLSCATDETTGDVVPFLLTIQAPYSGSPTVTINHRHPTRGDILLKPYCVTPQPAE